MMGGKSEYDQIKMPPFDCYDYDITTTSQQHAVLSKYLKV